MRTFLTRLGVVVLAAASAGGCLATAGCASPRRPLATIGASYSIMRDPVALEAMASESGPVLDAASGRFAGVSGRDDAR